MSKFFRNKNQGSALLSALFIMTLVAIAATAMSSRLQLDIYRTHLTIHSDELYLASQSVAFWAMDTLSNDSKKGMVNKEYKEDSELKAFPKRLQNDYPGIKVTGALYDLQAMFNLNNLQNQRFRPLGLRLLENTLESKNDAENKSIINAIIHWISPYQEQNQQQVFLDFYSNQHPPYKPSYQPMQSISELRLIHGINRKNYLKLLPFVTVLPEVTPINIITAPKAVLAILGNGLNPEQVNELDQARKKKGMKELSSIAPLLQKLDIPNDQITLESSYFLSIATAVSEDATLTTYTIINRNKNAKGVVSVGIVNQSLNTL